MLYGNITRGWANAKRVSQGISFEIREAAGQRGEICRRMLFKPVLVHEKEIIALAVFLRGGGIDAPLFEPRHFLREIEFLSARGHRLELDQTALPFLVRKGFHPKLGARPMRDAVEKLVGDAVSECLLAGRAACGILAHDEMRDCLGVF